MYLRFSHFLLLFFISGGVYANTLGHGFVWDDNIVLLENKWIKDFAGFQDIFSKDFCKGFEAHCGFYRPLVTLSYLLDYILWEFNPLGYHITNILFHVLTTLCIYIFVSILIIDFPSSQTERPFHRMIPLWSALLFAVLPIHSESVATVYGRTDPPTALFMLLAFMGFLFFRRKEGLHKYLGYAFSLFFFVLAILTKEIGVMLPILFFAYDFLYNKAKNVSIGKSVSFLPFFPFFLILFLYGMIRRNAVGYGMAVDFKWNTLPERIMEVPALLMGYFKIMAIPMPLTLFHRPPSIYEHPVLDGILPFLGLSILIIFVFKKIKTQPLYLFSAFWSAVTLFPVLNIIPINFAQGEAAVVERYAYVSSIGFSIFFALLFFELGGVLNRFSFILAKTAQGTLFLLILGGFTLILLQRNADWKNDLTLWSLEAKREGTSFIAYYNFGGLLLKNGYIEESKKQFKKAIASQPEDERAYLKLAEVYEQEGDLDEAIRTYQLVKGIKSDSFTIYLKLGELFHLKGQYNLAKKYLRTALKMGPKPSEIHTLLGRVEMSQNQPERAIKEFQKALQFNPKNIDGHFYLGMAFEQAEDFNKAKTHFLKALELDPSYGKAHRELGFLYLKEKGEREKADFHLFEAERLETEKTKAIEKTLKNLNKSHYE